MNDTRLIQHSIISMQQRLDRIEAKVFGTKKAPITLHQQILLLHHLGMLNALRQLDISNVKKAQLLAMILKGDSSNTKKAMEALGKKNDPSLINSFNYDFLLELFETYELNDLVTIAEKKLKEISK
jgi:hypothetical protein